MSKGDNTAEEHLSILPVMWEPLINFSVGIKVVCDVVKVMRNSTVQHSKCSAIGVTYVGITPKCIHSKKQNVHCVTQTENRRVCDNAEVNEEYYFVGCVPTVGEQGWIPE
ncbi:hypothetical protein JTB14_005020 [Gonioctena quinquepunctata]|nr:hypothetical protein JTB14_005020 [Gonioctena quinquepunctata]